MSSLVTHIIDGFSGKEQVAKKRIGLFFGSFNPIHIGHLIIGNYMAQLDLLDEVWFVVTPENPLKKKSNLLSDVHRLAMVRIAVEDNPKLKVCDIEFHLPKPSYTVYTLQALKEKYPQYVFTLIMGEDNLRTLHKWKNYEYILDNYSIFVYPRIVTEQELITPESADKKSTALPNVTITDTPILSISSSLIREMISNKKDVRYLLSEKVFTYLDEMNFYK
jgi:nicotinate-nucleotide adenylyltransferase